MRGGDGRGEARREKESVGKVRQSGPERAKKKDEERRKGEESAIEEEG